MSMVLLTVHLRLRHLKLDLPINFLTTMTVIILVTVNEYTEENETGHSDPLFEQMMQIPFHVPVSDLSDSATTAEEHASALKDSLITYAKSNFNRARITEVTFESAKNFCQQLGKIESVKFHHEKCIIGSEIQEREDIRVSKHVLRATFSFSKSTECVIVENFKESKLKEKAVIPFRSFLGVYVNKATKTVAGHLSFQPGRYQYDSDTKEWSGVSLPQVPRPVSLLSYHRASEFP